MAGESSNIAALAGLMANDIFTPLGWDESHGPRDENFKCLKPGHQPKKHTEHPVDVVFSYLSPYTRKKNYFLVDLKSYSKGTIEKKDLTAPLRSLAKTVSCAQVSKEWRSKYCYADDEDFVLHGMLFVYNHDSQYDKDFRSILQRVTVQDLEMPSDSRVFVIGPDDISYLLSMINDFKTVRLNNGLTLDDPIKFHCVNQVLQPAAVSDSPVAHIEAVIGPYQLISYDVKSKDALSRKDFAIYYRGQGKSPEEFEFILDFMLRKELIQSDNKISIIGMFLDHEAERHFKEAKTRLLSKMYNLDTFKDRLDQVLLRRADLVVRSFSKEVVGMERR